MKRSGRARPQRQAKTAPTPRRGARRRVATARARRIEPLYAVCGDFDLLLECNSCSEPGGHVYLLVHGEYRCVHCGLGELC